MVRLDFSSTRIAAAVHFAGVIGTFSYSLSAVSHPDGLVRVTLSLLLAQIWPIYWSTRSWWDSFLRLPILD